MSVILLFAVACGSTTPKTTETAPPTPQPAATDQRPTQDTTPPETAPHPGHDAPGGHLPAGGHLAPEDTAVPETTHPTIQPDWPDSARASLPHAHRLKRQRSRRERRLPPAQRAQLPPDGAVSLTTAAALPLVIGWHWMNASSSSFVRDGELERAVEEMDFIALFLTTSRTPTSSTGPL
ncbi:MAG: hypothetical protein IPI35_19700 [Deltaproteobacteria bacterium]|nr:hypothetical protein [Deltaproteobacteria bacterium]